MGIIRELCVGGWGNNLQRKRLLTYCYEMLVAGCSTLNNKMEYKENDGNQLGFSPEEGEMYMRYIFKNDLCYPFPVSAQRYKCCEVVAGFKQHLHFQRWGLQQIIIPTANELVAVSDTTWWLEIKNRETDFFLRRNEKHAQCCNHTATKRGVVP